MQKVAISLNLGQGMHAFDFASGVFCSAGGGSSVSSDCTEAMFRLMFSELSRKAANLKNLHETTEATRAHTLSMGVLVENVFSNAGKFSRSSHSYWI